MNKPLKPLVKDLGFCMARVTFSLHNSFPTLYIVSPSFTEDGAYTPAESVGISSVDGIRALHELLTEVIKQHDKAVEL
jgi:hypothetical protein